MKPRKEPLSGTLVGADCAYLLDRTICRALADMPDIVHDFDLKLWRELIFATRRVTELRPK
jgi:hypothetical protein